MRLGTKYFDLRASRKSHTEKLPVWYLFIPDTVNESKEVE